MNNRFKILDNGLTINKISKTYGNKEVVRDVSISIKRNEVVGLLGPNGAGKTTTFYIIVGLVKPDRGSIILDNLDELESTISDLIENKIKMKDLGENAKKRAQSQLSWTKIIKDYNKLIAETQL